MAFHIERKIKIKPWKVVGKAGWRHNEMVSSVFEFVCLAMNLLNLHWQQQGRERKREKVRESLFNNNTENWIFPIILCTPVKNWLCVTTLPVGGGRLSQYIHNIRMCSKWIETDCIYKESKRWIKCLLSTKSCKFSIGWNFFFLDEFSV